MKPRPIALLALVAFALGAGGGSGSAVAAVPARDGVSSTRAPDAPSSTAPAPASVNRSPSSAPLLSAEAGAAGAAGGEEGAGETPQAEVDPLVSNGLGSPTCRGALASELTATSRRNCETSGFVAAPAPTGDYGIDVHIDTGVLDLGSGGALSIVQDLFVTPLWMALVWAVHALVVMLEWCFTIDLLDSAAALGVGSGLRRMQATFTEPWLPMALAAASALALYHGLVRRRVAETLGETLLMGAMMLAGIWVITDPTGTVGALGQWANQASLGTLAVAARGTPASPGRALEGSLDTVFTAAIEVPWCYLEFGDVGWCREPARLNPRLRAAAVRIAAQETAQVGCQPSPASPSACVRAGSAQANALEHSAELLRDAQSNGAIFLALPANGPARNSINEHGSLLRTLCQSSDATNCRGPTAAQAEFRTAGQTWSRVGGVLLIAGGLLGMLLLLGFVALRLLAAAIFSLLYLLLTPAMVLAPAFGEGGRALFRRWGAQLLGAVVSKLVFSFLLGVVLAVLAILADLESLGWWTQWLLMSAFWWGAYTRRHQALGVAAGALSDRRWASGHAERRSVVRRVSDMLESRKGMTVARWAKSRLSTPAPSVEQRRKLAQAGRRRAQAMSDQQARRTLEGEHRDASARASGERQVDRQLSVKRAQLERVRRQGASALAAGDGRRTAELGQREARVAGEIEREQDALNGARLVANDGEQARRRTGNVYTRERLEQQQRFLDAQAALPPSGRARERSDGGRPRGERRDYAALAALAGYGREEYERLEPGRERAARLEIDRELALRRELAATARSFSAGGESLRLGRRERRAADRKFDGALQRRMRDGGHGMPEQSSVMRDAHEVAARRKRQLGRDRP